MTRRWFHVGFILLALAGSAFGQDRTTLLQSLGDTPGVEPLAAPTTWEAPTLDQFDRALASDLRLYGARGIAAQQWKTSAGPVKITLFQMNDSPAAYGVYTLLRSRLGGDPTRVLIGASSFRIQDQLYFWQSSYTVQVVGSSNAQEQVAQTLSRKILGASRKPPVSEYLPATNMIAGTEKYILSPESMDRVASLDSAKLGFDFSAEAATAAYRAGGQQARLLLVLYPTQHIAKKHADEIESGAGISSAFLKRAGPLMAIVYGTTDQAFAASILDGVSHEFKVTWNEPQPGLGLGTMLITIFTFIAIALVFTTIAGVSYGGLRVFVKSRYPNRVFDRPEAMEIIQLKLIQGVTDRQIETKSSNGSA